MNVSATCEKDVGCSNPAIGMSFSQIDNVVGSFSHKDDWRLGSTLGRGALFMTYNCVLVCVLSIQIKMFEVIKTNARAKIQTWNKSERSIKASATCEKDKALVGVEPLISPFDCQCLTPTPR